MLMTGVLQALTFLFFLLLGGHGLIGGGGADTSEWVYLAFPSQRGTLSLY
jgi:hypothetical protein